MPSFTLFCIVIIQILKFSSSCPEHCLSCDSNERCLTCTDGFWGTFCELPCSRCQPNTSCEKTNGFCLEQCKDGYTGILCDAVCNKKCLSCDRMNAGQCEKCSQGFCQNKTCNDTGHCTSGCENGYWGPLCDKRCSRHCKHGCCNRQSGKCIHGCDDATFSTACGTLVNDPEFQATLAPDENCKTALENSDKSVKNGDGTSIIDVPRKQKDQSNTLNSAAITLIVIFATVVIMAFIILFVCVHRKRRQQHRKRRQQQHLPQEERMTLAGLLSTNETAVMGNLDAIHKEGQQLSEKNDTDIPVGKNYHTVDFIGEEDLKQKNQSTVSSLEHKIEIIQPTDFTSEEDQEKKNLATPSVVTKIGLGVPRIIVGPRAFRESSYVSDFTGLKAYIVCQDPINCFNKDEASFWQMVWEEECGIIVKLSRTSEETSVTKYWRDKNQEVNYLSFTVTTIDELIFDEFTQRTFDIGTVYKKEEPTTKRKVFQMHFQKWPKDRFPEDEMSLLKFRQTVQILRTEPTRPLLVHCSDGISRSRLYVALDIVLKELERQDSDDVAVVKCLDLLKEKRFISSEEQYNFLVRTIAKWKEKTLL